MPANTEFATELRFSLAHQQVAALRMGNPEGIPCLCLHGWLDNANSFLPLAEALPDFQWIAIDFPGHGKSDWLPEGQRYHLLDHIPTIAQVLEQLGWQQCHLFGHSMGACLAPALIASLPERFLSFVSIEALGSVTEDPKELPQRLQRAQQDLQKPLRNSRRYDSVDSATDHRLKATQMAETSARLIVERSLQDTGDGLHWRYDPRLRLTSPSYLSEDQCHALLKAIHIPTLGLLADEGYILKRPTYALRQGLIPHYQEHIHPGHHHIHMDAPELLSETIRGFVQQHHCA